jgi:membrane protein YdbS with pleckstrin-like domain
MNADIPGTVAAPDIVRPSSRLRILYNLYLLVVVWFLAVPGLLILSAFVDPITMISVSVVVLILALVAITVIRRTTDSLVYVFDEHALEVRRGPGNARRVSIPYSGISSAVIIRRRLPSYFGMASVRIAYATNPGDDAWVTLNGIEDPEGFHSLIMSRTGKNPG